MSAGTEGLPPEAAVVRMGTAYWMSQAVRAMALLGLADHLLAGPRTVEELAEGPPRTLRVWRAFYAPWSPWGCANGMALVGSS